LCILLISVEYILQYCYNYEVIETTFIFTNKKEVYKMKYSFLNDYSEGAHESVLAALSLTNRLQTPGYGTDVFCTRAADAIRRALGRETSKIHFLTGGTQTNLTVISALLRPHQGVIAAETGHINVHESGAIEATGHKVLALPAKGGKITAKAVADLLAAHFADSTAEHCVQPGMLYISQPTELGTIYSKQELTELCAVCREYEIPFFIDGARLGCALTCDSNDTTLSDLAELCDLFYIGGTKMGALFGEALVVNNIAYNKDLRYIIKQKGGMLAKGRILGIQFEALFTDDLYFKLAKHANDAAKHLAAGIKALGYSFDAEPATNQLFPVFPRKLIEQLREDYWFEFNRRVDDEHDCIRLCTSWASDIEKIDEFLSDLALLGGKK